MIVGCYTLELYCDGCNVNWKHGDARPATFTGETGAQCRNEAREAGWKLNTKGDRALCPACSKRGA